MTKYEGTFVGIEINTYCTIGIVFISYTQYKIVMCQIPQFYRGIAEVTVSEFQQYLIFLYWVLNSGAGFLQNLFVLPS